MFQQQAHTYESREFGYMIDVPADWRRSERLSLVITDNKYHRGHDVFTLRNADDEENATKQSDWLGPAWQGAVVIEVYRNPLGLTALQWATRPEWDWRTDQVLAAATLAGREAVLINNGARFAVAYYVPRGSDMFVVGYLRHADWEPSTLNPADLVQIVSSFRLREDAP